MLTRVIVVAIAAVALGGVGGMAAPAGASTNPVVVNYGDCAFGSGTANVAAGVPITLENTGSWATGTYGLALDAVNKSKVTATIAVTGGATSVMSLTFSQPAYFGDPYFAWLAFLPDISLDPLAPGGSVLVTIETSHSGPVEVVFPGQRGRFHFGPFHIGAGDSFEASCLITAA
jgi:hypothetical protein